ncbi:YhfC family intramembrane metalloprotease [Saccharopolyspora spinosa]|uniref:Uncharacterized protein n=1 Tax=Saccharopolyspora spinosa TaxID=60894 RepID=A0A2N3XY63_SACSN|nr:YhfC family intramembrane metalloprotease [Saccharopolyspora spinosa]PKW15635.1 hypothetical protein A8926_3378 [Saccharopolyspora spinosa]
MWLLPQELPSGAAERLSGSPWWTSLLPRVERPIAVACPVGFAALIVLAYRRSALFLPVPVAAHFVVDLVTFGLQGVAGGCWRSGPVRSLRSVGRPLKSWWVTLIPVTRAANARIPWLIRIGRDSSSPPEEASCCVALRPRS